MRNFSIPSALQQSGNILNYWRIQFLRGCSVRNEPDQAFVIECAATKERKDKAYFIQSFHIWHMNRKMFETGFEEITNSEFVEGSDSG